MNTGKTRSGKTVSKFRSAPPFRKRLRRDAVARWAGVGISVSSTRARTTQAIFDCLARIRQARVQIRANLLAHRAEFSPHVCRCLRDGLHQDGFRRRAAKLISANIPDLPNHIRRIAASITGRIVHIIIIYPDTVSYTHLTLPTTPYV